jgi:hypothetical protein
MCLKYQTCSTGHVPSSAFTAACVVSTACSCSSLHSTPQSVPHRQLQLPHHRTVVHAFATGGPHKQHQASLAQVRMLSMLSMPGTSLNATLRCMQLQ